MSELIDNLSEHTKVRQPVAPMGVDGSSADAAAGERPDWAHPGVVTRRFDARKSIEAGGHPLLQVSQDLRELLADESYELTTGVIPTPLIERVRSQGYRVWSTEEGDAPVRTYITRAPRGEGRDT